MCFFFFYILASVSSLVSPFGLLIFGILTDKIGRKKTFQLSYVLITASWLILAYADSYETILIGRIVVGITFGKLKIKKIYLFYIHIYLSVPNIYSFCCRNYCMLPITTHKQQYEMLSIYFLFMSLFLKLTIKK